MQKNKQFKSKDLNSYLVYKQFVYRTFLKLKIDQFLNILKSKCPFRTIKHIHNEIKGSWMFVLRKFLYSDKTNKSIIISSDAYCCHENFILHFVALILFPVVYWYDKSVFEIPWTIWIISLKERSWMIVIWWCSILNRIVCCNFEDEEGPKIIKKVSNRKWQILQIFTQIPYSAVLKLFLFHIHIYIL